MSEPERLRFPTVPWARSEAFGSPWCLSQSGMPVPEASPFEGLGIDLSHPGAEALPALRARLGELFAVDPARVLVTVGASAAMHLCALRHFRPGARVAVELPSNEPVRALARLFGAEVAPCRLRPEDGWRIDPGRLRALLAGAGGPGHVFLTNPNNPTGALLEAERVRAVAAEAERAGGVLVSCEVTMEYAPNAARAHAFALAPNAISIGSLSKAYGLGALRIGWLILGAGLAGEMPCYEDLAGLTWVDPPTSSLVAGLRALDEIPRLLQPLRRVERESRPHWERWLAAGEEVEACQAPPYGIVAFPRVRGVDDTAALARFLQAEHGVDVVPGEFFGLAGYLRVGCGVPEETLVEGLRRLSEGIRAFRARS